MISPRRFRWAVAGGALAVALGGGAGTRAANSFGDPGDYLRYGAGARPLGMGGAFTAVADDATAEYWNPAALAFLSEYQMVTMYAPFALDTNFYYASVGVPLGPEGALAASDLMLRSDGFQSRNDLNLSLGDHGSVLHNALSVSYARPFRDRWSAGVRLRMLQQKVLEDSGSVFAVDLSAYSRPLNGVSAGLSLANLNRPKITLASASDEFQPNLRGGVAFHGPQDRFLVALDANKTAGQGLYAAAGLEYSPFSLLSLRGGWDQNETFTAGVGVRFRLFNVDYAFSTRPDLGDYSKISLTWRWGNVYRAKIEPEGIAKGSQAIFVEGLKNEVTFRTGVPRFRIIEWSLDITREDGTAVRALRQPASPPEAIVWDMTDNASKPVKRGRYDFLFRVRYKNGNLWEERGHFRLDYRTNAVGGVDANVRGDTVPDLSAPAEPPAPPDAPPVPLEAPRESDLVPGSGAQ